MKYEEFLKKALEDNFTIRSTQNRSIRLYKQGYFIDIPENEEIDYKEFLASFENVKQDFPPDSDLYPNIGMGKGKYKGMFVQPDDPIFGERLIRRDNGDEIDVPPFAKFDPILPETKKGKKRGNDPDPDHFKKPDNDGDYFM